MQRFFCNYNLLTERRELSLTNRNGIFAKNYNSSILTTDNLLGDIRNHIQNLYENIVLIKEKETDEKRMEILDETELMVSNLYYSLFASPLELVEKEGQGSLENCKKEITYLIKDINIPEYNRLCDLISNNLNLL